MSSVTIGGGNLNIGLAYLDQQRRAQQQALSNWQAQQQNAQAQQELQMRAQQMQLQQRNARIAGLQQAAQAQQDNAFRYAQLGQQGSQFQQSQQAQQEQFKTRAQQEAEQQAYMRARNDKLFDYQQGQDQQRYGLDLDKLDLENIKNKNWMESQKSDDEIKKQGLEERKTVLQNSLEEKQLRDQQRDEDRDIQDIQLKHKVEMDRLTRAYNKVAEAGGDTSALDREMAMVAENQNNEILARRQLNARNKQINGLPADQASVDQEGPRNQASDMSPQEMQIGRRNSQISGLDETPVSRRDQVIQDALKGVAATKSEDKQVRDDRRVLDTINTGLAKNPSPEEYAAWVGKQANWDEQTKALALSKHPDLAAQSEISKMGPAALAKRIERLSDPHWAAVAQKSGLDIDRALELAKSRQAELQSKAPKVGGVPVDATDPDIRARAADAAYEYANKLASGGSGRADKREIARQKLISDGWTEGQADALLSERRSKMPTYSNTRATGSWF